MTWEHYNHTRVWWCHFYDEALFQIFKAILNILQIYWMKGCTMLTNFPPNYNSFCLIAGNFMLTETIVCRRQTEISNSKLYDNVNTLRVLTMTVGSSTPQMCVSASRFPTMRRSAGPWARMELTLMKSLLWFLFYHVAAGVGVRALIRREQRDGKWIFNFHTMRDRWGRTPALGELCCRLKGDERWCEKLKESGGIMPGATSDLLFFLLEGGNGRRSVMWHTGWH